MSRRHVNVLALAVTAALSGYATTSYGAENDPIIFTPPVATPQGGAGTAGVYEVTGNGDTGNQDNARISLNTAALNPAAVKTPYTVSTINFGPNDGHFFGANGGGNAPNQVFKNNDANNIAVAMQGLINIPAAGTYTFGVNSDDGFTLAFPGRSFTAVTQANSAALQTYNGTANGAFQFYGGRGNTDSLASITFPSAGAVPFHLVFAQGGGGYGVELFAAQGSKAAFDDSFNLVGQGAIPAAPKITEKRASGMGGLSVAPFNYTEIHNGTGTNPDNSAFGPGTNNVTQLLTAFANGSGTRTVRTPTLINYIDPEGANAGGHNPTANFPGDTLGVDDNNFGAVATTVLSVDGAHAGKYTFVVYTDDGHAMDIRQGTSPAGTLVPLFRADNTDVLDRDGVNGNDTLFNDGGCCADRLGVWDLATGTYTLEAAFNEQGGGAGFFIFGAKGDVPLRQGDGSFNPQFVLLGDTSTSLVDFVTQDVQVARPAGLQFAAVPEPTTVSLLALGGMAFLARRRKA